jgi:hypothetical protein
MSSSENLSSTFGGYSSNLSIESRLSDSDFVPDGDLEKLAWRKAHFVEFDHDWAGKQHYPQAATRVRSLWTPSHVYFAFWCNHSGLNVFPEDDPKEEKDGLWERDVVEIFINPRPRRVEHYYEFEVSPNNLWIDLEIDLNRRSFNDMTWNSGFSHATWIDEKIWTCEIRIPVRALCGEDEGPSVHDEWRVNFYRADGEGDNTVRRLLAWSPTRSPKPNFHVPSSFGLFRFVQ